MNILFLSYDLPYPLDSGGKIRAYYLIKSLAKRHKIHLRYFYRDKKQKEQENHLARYLTTIEGYERRPLFSIKTLKYLPLRPFPVALYSDSALSQDIRQQITTYNIDCAHFESIYVTSLLQSCSTIPTIYGSENIEWRFYKSFIEQDRQFRLIKKPLYSYELARIKNYEINLWKKADYTIAVSEENRKEIAQYAQRDVQVIPNGVDIDTFMFKKQQAREVKTIAFIGNFSYIQNQQAALVLLDSIIPRLPLTMQCLLVGRRPTAEIYEKSNTLSNVHLCTTIDDITTIYDKADLIVAPLFSGSGTKFKILEALASGVPIVTTPYGVEGLSLPEGVVSNVSSVPDIVHAIMNLTTDQKSREIMAEKGRLFVEKNMSWGKIGDSLLDFYETINHHNH